MKAHALSAHTYRVIRDDLMGPAGVVMHHSAHTSAHALEAHMQPDPPQKQSNPIASFSNPWPAVPAGLEERPYDHWHIDLRECWEVEFWMKHLCCEEPALRDAVFRVGARVGAVRARLASHS